MVLLMFLVLVNYAVNRIKKKEEKKIHSLSHHSAGNSGIQMHNSLEILEKKCGKI